MPRIGMVVVSIWLAWSGSSEVAYSQPAGASDDPAAVAALQRMNAGLVYDETGCVTSLAPPPERGADALKFVPGLPRLSSLDLSKSTVAGEDLQHIRSATQLEVLNLSRTAVGDAAMVHVAQLAGLETLDLSHNPITDDGVAHLTKLRNLKYLRLKHTQVTDAGIVPLGKMSNLRFLDVWGTAVNEDAARHLKQRNATISVVYTWDDYRSAEVFRRHDVTFHMNDAGRLATVRIDPTDWEKEVIASLFRLDHVEELILANCSVDDGQVAKLAQNQRLKTLDLSGTLITDQGMVHLAQHPCLAKVDLRRTIVTAAGLGKVTRLENLTDLYLSRHTTSSERLRGLSPATMKMLAGRAGRGFAGLRIESKEHEGQRRLVVVGSGVSDDMLKAIAPLKNVGWAALPNSDVTDAGLRHLETWSRLRELNIASPHVTDAGMRTVAKIGHLQYLVVDCPKVGNPGLTHLAKLPHLKALFVRSDRVTSDGVPELSRLISAKVTGIHSGTVTHFGFLKLQNEVPQTFIDISTPRWPAYYIEQPGVFPR